MKIRRVSLLAVVLLAACGTSSADPALELRVFEQVDCGESGDASSEDCYELQVAVVGSEPSDESGSCELIAFAKDGSELEKGPTVGPIALTPGEKFKEVVAVPRLDGQDLDFWEPHCLPTGEG